MAERVAALPPMHKDPIDRAPVAHPTVQNMPVLTSDATTPRYGAQTIR